MPITHHLRTLGRIDLTLMRRDRFVLLMWAMVVYIGVFLRFGLPWLNTYLATEGLLPNEKYLLPLSAYYPMIMAYMGLYTGATLVGTVFGFLLLEEKDDNTLKAMLVTPVPLSHYLFYRVGVPVLWAFAIIVALLLFVGLALVPLWQLLLLAAGAALGAPLVTLFFATFAANKVQGFALSKFTSLAGWTILFGWFLDAPWQWLLGLFPPFWISKAYWMALAGEPWWGAVLLGGICLHLPAFYLLVRRFNTVVHR